MVIRAFLTFLLSFLLATGVHAAGIVNPPVAGGVDTDDSPTWSGNHTFDGDVTFNGTVTGVSGLPDGFSGNPTKIAVYFQPSNLTATSLDVYGSGTSLTVGGTTQTALVDATGAYVNSAAGSSSGNDFGWYQGAAWVQRRLLPEITYSIKTGTDITSIRLWVGFASGGANIFGENLPGSGQGLMSAAFRYSTAVDGTAFWRTVTSDALTTSETVTTTTASIAANTRYKLRIAMSASDVKFYVDDVLVATHTTNLPTDSQSLGFVCGGENLAASSRSVRLARIYLERN